VTTAFRFTTKDLEAMPEIECGSEIEAGETDERSGPARLPSEAVLDLLPPQQGEFTKEDGEPVVDSAGRRIGIA